MESEKEARATLNRKIGIAVSYVAIFVQIIISIFFTKYVLNTIGDRQYGLYSFVLSIASWLSTLLIALTSGFNKYITREKSIDGESGERRAIGIFFKIYQVLTLITIATGLTIWCLFYFKYIPLTEYNDSEQQTICTIMLITFSAVGLTTALTSYKSYFYYKQAYIVINSIGLLSTILQTIVSFLLIYNGFGVISLAASSFAVGGLASLAETIIAITVYKERMTIKPKTPEEKAKSRMLFTEILIFSSFVIMNTVADVLNKNAGKTILGFANADSVANFQLATNFSGYITSLSSAISVVFVQKLNDLFFSDKTEDRKAVNSLFITVSKFQMLVVFFVVGGFAACGYDFVIAWIGESRIQVYYVALVILVAGLYQNTSSLAIEARRILNLHKKAAFVYLANILLNVGISILCIKLMDKSLAIWGCTIGFAVSSIVCQWIVLAIYDQKLTKLNLKAYYWNFFKFFLYAGTSAGIVWVIFRFARAPSNEWMSVIVKGIVYSIFYGITIFIFERKFIAEILKRKNGEGQNAKRQIVNAEEDKRYLSKIKNETSLGVVTFRKNKKKDLALSLSVLLLMVVSALTFGGATDAKRSAFAIKAVNAAKSDTDSIIYGEGSFPIEHTRSNYENIVAKQRDVYNIGNDFNSYAAFSSDDGSPLQLPLNISNGSEAISEDGCSIVTLSVFSNTKKFETLDVELYKETTSDLILESGTNGCSYIPDYMADSLIKNTSLGLTNYDDLIDAKLKLQMTVGGKTLVYKIANVFKVEGFTYLPDGQSLTYPDWEEGKRIRSFLGNYVITFFQDRNAAGMVPNTSIFFDIPARQYSLQNLGSVLFSGQKSDQLCTFYTKADNQFVKNESLDGFSDLYCGESNNLGSGVNAFGLVSLIILSCPLIVFLRYYLFRKDLSITELLLSFLPPALYSLIGTIVIFGFGDKVPIMALEMLGPCPNLVFVVLLFGLLVFLLIRKKTNHEKTL
jgi:O-antigen/teichoic acid export membrane protein